MNNEISTPNSDVSADSSNVQTVMEQPEIQSEVQATEKKSVTPTTITLTSDKSKDQKQDLIEIVLSSYSELTKTHKAAIRKNAVKSLTINYNLTINTSTTQNEVDIAARSPFYGMTDLKSLDFEVHFGAEVTCAVGLFKGLNNLVKAPKLVNTGSIQNMSAMFWGCANLMIVPKFDTAGCIYMGNMFRECKSLLQVPKFDTAQVTSMNDMFRGCANLKKIPLLDIHNVKIMSAMFYGCEKLQEVPEFDTQSAENMNSMFRNCKSLSEIPVLNTSSVKDMRGMFQNATSLRKIPELDIIPEASLTNVVEGCEQLLVVPDILKQFVKNKEAKASTAAKSTKAAKKETQVSVEKNKVVQPKNADNSSSKPESKSKAEQKPKVTKVVVNLSSYDDVATLFLPSLKAHTIKKLIINYDLIRLPSYDYDNISTNEELILNWNSPFYELKDLEEIDFPIEFGPNVTSAQGLFAGLEKLEKISSIDCSHVSDLSRMFHNCKSLKSIPKFDTSSCTNMNYMFAECESIKSVPAFDTSNVKSMVAMFRNARKLEGVPSFSVKKLTDASYMFFNCETLKKAPRLYFTSECQTTNIYKSFSNIVTTRQLNRPEDLSEMLQDVKLKEALNQVNSILELEINYPLKYDFFVPAQNTKAFGGNSPFGSLSQEQQDFLKEAFSRIHVRIKAGINCNSFDGLFAHIDYLRKVEVDMSRVVSASNMFVECTELTEVILRNPDALEKTDWMFLKCSSLVKLSPFPMNTVKDASGMFFDCTALKQLDILGTSNIENFTSMFDGCSNLESISSRIDIKHAKNISWMFAGCKKLSRYPLSPRSNSLFMRYDLSENKEVFAHEVFKDSYFTTLNTSPEWLFLD